MATETDSQEGDEALLIEGLRTPGDEKQFTRTIAALADQDLRFARSFLSLVLSEAPYAAQRGLLAHALEGADVRCEAERPVYDRAGRQRGRVDLLFHTTDLTVLLEAKIWSDYRENQLEDYLASARSDDRRYVVSITRNVSRYREPCQSEPRWLGAIRWARLAPKMRDLPHAESARRGWNILLDVMSRDGDFGDLQLSRDLVDAWAMYDEATDRLTTFLEEIGHDSLAFLRARLAGRRACRRDRTAAFVPLRKSRSNRSDKLSTKPGRVPIKNEGGLLSIRFAIPAAGAQRLEIGFDIPEDTPRFFITAEVLEPNELSAEEIVSWQAGHRHLTERYAADPVADLGEWDDFGIDIAVPLAHFVDNPDVPRRMSDLIHHHVAVIIGSGLFDRCFGVR